MPELLATLDASRKSTEREHIFLAAMQGVDLTESGDSETTSFEDVRHRANVRRMGGDPDANDITSLHGEYADQIGFGIGQGLGYETI